MTFPALIAQLEPVREARKPVECQRSQTTFTGPCWVAEPYRALGPNIHCKGCAGKINPQGLRAPRHDELVALGISR